LVGWSPGDALRGSNCSVYRGLKTTCKQHGQQEVLLCAARGAMVHAVHPRPVMVEAPSRIQSGVQAARCAWQTHTPPCADKTCI
jgi:hypothetical protein